MNIIDKIKNILKESNYNYDNDLYFIFMYASNVFTGKIKKDMAVSYTDKEDVLPEDDSLFLEGYVFNKDIQIDIDKEDGIEVIKQNDIDRLSLDKIEENMFLLSDNKTSEITSTYTKLIQGKKTVIVPKLFSNNEISEGLTLKVINYIDYDQNDFPFVRFVRFIDFNSYKEKC